MNQEKIIQAIAAYLEFDTMDRFKKIYANRLHSKVTQDDINRYQSPPNEWPDDCVAIKSRRELIATQGKKRLHWCKKLPANSPPPLPRTWKPGRDGRMRQVGLTTLQRIGTGKNIGLRKSLINTNPGAGSIKKVRNTKK